MNDDITVLDVVARQWHRSKDFRRVMEVAPGDAFRWLGLPEFEASEAVVVVPMEAGVSYLVAGVEGLVNWSGAWLAESLRAEVEEAVRDARADMRAEAVSAVARRAGRTVVLVEDVADRRHLLVPGDDLEGCYVKSTRHPYGQRPLQCYGFLTPGLWSRLPAPWESLALTAGLRVRFGRRGGTEFAVVEGVGQAYFVVGERLVEVLRLLESGAGSLAGRTVSRMGVVELFVRGLLSAVEASDRAAGGLWGQVDVEPGCGDERISHYGVSVSGSLEDKEETGGLITALVARLVKTGFRVRFGFSVGPTVRVFWGAMESKWASVECGVWVAVLPFWGGWILAGSNMDSGGPCPLCFRERLRRSVLAETFEGGLPQGEVLESFWSSAKDAVGIFVAELVCERPGRGLVWSRRGPLGIEQGHFEHSAYCPRCGGDWQVEKFSGGMGSRLDVPGETAAGFLGRAQGAIGSVVGVVSRIEDIQYWWDPNALWAHSALGVRENTNLVDGRYGSHFSSGKGRSRTGARAGALAEGIEFDCLRFDAARCVRGTYREMCDRGVVFAPSDLLRVSEAQWEGEGASEGSHLYRQPLPERFTEKCWDRPLYWIDGWDMVGEGVAWFPASYVFTAEISDVEDGRYEGKGRFFHGVHSGAATGPTRVDAACRGLCELFERDGVALWWYLRVARPVVRLGGVEDPWLGQAGEWFARAGRELRVFDISTCAELPAVVAVSWLEEPSMFGYDVVLSGGCSTSMRLACRRAVAENVQHTHASGGNFVYHSRRFDERFAREWARLDPHAEQWLSVGLPDVPGGYEVRDDLTGVEFREVCLSVMRGYGLAWYVVDISAIDFGVAVMRSIAPGLLPLFPLLGHGRLYRGAREAGWVDRDFCEDEVNPMAYVF